MPRTIHLFVFDSLADWEPGYAIAGINTPGFQREPGRYAVRTFSLDGDPVTTAGGLRVHADMAMSDVVPDESAMLIIPGGTAWDEGKNGEVVELAVIDGDVVHSRSASRWAGVVKPSALWRRSVL